MELAFTTLRQALEKRKIESPQIKFRSERSSIFSELYSYYEKSYRKNTWIAYVSWLKKNKYKHTRERVEQYKKDPTFRKKITVKSFCSFWLGFLSTQDLYYLCSIAKDMDKRNENFNRWLFWAIRAN